MRTMETKKEYTVITNRIEELLTLVDNNTPTNDRNFIELDLLSDLVADYEETIEPNKSTHTCRSHKITYV